MSCLHANLCSLHFQEAMCRYVMCLYRTSRSWWSNVTGRDLILQSKCSSERNFLENDSMIQVATFKEHVCCISKCHVCSILFPVYCPIAFLCFSCSSMISWVFPEEYPLGCWEMQQNPIRGESEAGELAAIKDWFPGCLSVSMKENEAWRKGAFDIRRWKSGKIPDENELNMPWQALLWRSWLRWQNSRWVFLEHVLMRLETSAIFYVSASQKVSSLICVFQEKAEAKAYCRCLSRIRCLTWWACYFILFLRWCPWKWSRAEELHEVLGRKDSMTMWPYHPRNSCCWPVRRGR